MKYIKKIIASLMLAGVVLVGGTVLAQAQQVRNSSGNVVGRIDSDGSIRNGSGNNNHGQHC